MMLYNEPILWENGWVFAWIPALLLLIGFLGYHYWAHAQWLKSLASEQFRSRILIGYSPFKWFMRFFFITCAAVALFLACGRMQWGKKEEIVEQEGRDVVVLLDISRSMQASDVLPTRLEFVKYKLKALLSKLSCERVGLILFSGSAFVQSPLTTDYEAFKLFLDQVDVELIASGTTAIDRALLKAIELFEQSRGASNRLIVLATDGEDFSAHLQGAQRRAQDLGIKVIAYGIGSEQGAPIPCKDAAGRTIGYERDAQGGMVMSTLNVPHLQDIAQKLSGYFIKATMNDDDLDGIVNYLTSFEKEKFEDKKISLYEERYPFFTGAAAVCYAIHALL